MAYYRAYFSKIGYFELWAENEEEAEKEAEDLINDSDPTFLYDDWLFAEVEPIDIKEAES